MRVDEMEDFQATREKLQQLLDELQQAELPFAEKVDLKNAEKLRLVAEEAEQQRQENLKRLQEEQERLVREYDEALKKERERLEQLANEQVANEQESETQLTLDDITEQATGGFDLDSLLDLQSSEGPSLEDSLPDEILLQDNRTPLALQDIGRIVQESVTGVLAKDNAKKQNRVSISSFQKQDWKGFLQEFRQFVTDTQSYAKYNKHKVKGLEANFTSLNETLRSVIPTLEALNEKIYNVESRLKINQEARRVERSEGTRSRRSPR